jgi:hypothetical protein
MKGLILNVIAATSMTPSPPAPSMMSPVLVSARPAATQSLAVSDWYVSAQVAEGCRFQAEGVATDSSGANLAMTCAAGNPVVGNVSAQISAQGWRQRRITISAEIKVDDAMSASLWLKTQHGNTALMFDDDSEQNLLSTTRTADGWERRVITLPIAADATQVRFGVLVQGTGAVTVRDLHLQISQPGAMSAEASQMLDAALAIVKQQTRQRDDLSWQVLEPQLRLFASGAQSAAEVYPAIKYLLSCLRDKRSLLLTSEVAAALNRTSAADSTQSGHAGDNHIEVFTLPDGARLVLSRMPLDPAVRTARTQQAIEALP